MPTITVDSATRVGRVTKRRSRAWARTVARTSRAAPAESTRATAAARRQLARHRFRVRRDSMSRGSFAAQRLDVVQDDVGEEVGGGVDLADHPARVDEEDFQHVTEARGRAPARPALDPHVLAEAVQDGQELA